MVMSIVTWIIVGAIGGWLAGYILHKNTAFNMMDVILGMVGAVVGGVSVHGVAGTGRRLGPGWPLS